MNQRQLELQRDLYKLLLDINDHNSPSVDSCLSSALNLVVQLTSARIGYIELRNARGKTWWSTYHCSEEELETIRKRISTGIISEALSSNKTVFTPSAFFDPRFQERDSVQAGQIEAVLCSPFTDGDTTGVVYLQSDARVKLDAADCMMETERFTRHITPLLKKLKYHVESIKPEDDLRTKFRIETIIGESQALKKILYEAMAIAEIDVPVLITGQTGTGKNLLAKAIHENSPRRQKPFVHINCTNLPEALLESELFGVVRGAHSSAFSTMKGKISVANGGTLFLDEIGELTLPVQSKLLQFLDNGYYYPLGSEIITKADVRLITASNKNFATEMKNGTFRRDLYYRIGVFPIEMPPLRKRKEDIPHLVHFLLEKHCNQYHLPMLTITPQTMSQIEECPWPGNIRELENTIQQGIVRAKAHGSSQIEIKYILSDIPQTDSFCIDGSGTYKENKDSWEKYFIELQLEKNNWNITETARSLNLSRSHMNNLIRTHKLERTIKEDRKDLPQ